RVGESEDGRAERGRLTRPLDRLNTRRLGVNDREIAVGVDAGDAAVDAPAVCQRHGYLVVAQVVRVREHSAISDDDPAAEAADADDRGPDPVRNELDRSLELL